MIRLRATDLHWRVVDGEVIAIDLRSGRYLGLNGSGAGLWELIAAGATREELVERLVRDYGIDRARARRDVDALLADLVARTLLAGGETC